jgi:hypothetical protein
VLAASELDRLAAIAGRPDELGRRGVADQGGEPAPVDRVVVGHEHVDHDSSGRVARTRVPAGTRRSTRRLPPSSLARSRIDAIPRPA